MVYRIAADTETPTRIGSGLVAIGAVSHVCTGTGARPCPRLHRDWGPPLPTSAPGLGLAPAHICTGTGWALPSRIGTETGPELFGRDRGQVHRHRICGDFVRLVPPALLHVLADQLCDQGTFTFINWSPQLKIFDAAQRRMLPLRHMLHLPRVAGASCCLLHEWK